MRVISEYMTVSAEIATVVVRMAPFDLLAEESERLHRRVEENLGGLKATERKETMRSWQDS